MACGAGQPAYLKYNTNLAIPVLFLMVSRNFAADFAVPIWPTMNFTPAG